MGELMMDEKQDCSGAPADADAKRVEAAMQRGVRQALWEHKQLGHHIIVWRDGKIVRVPPEEINVEKPSLRDAK
ncbi:MAG TPA: hypothetical protein VGH74_12265 [Planctomycetaceae bacterium]|jgi:hypothetical protein